MLELETLKTRFHQRKEQILKDFFTYLRFPSIATDGAYAKDVHACADWLIDYLKKGGLQVEKWETKHAPTVFATDLRAGPEKETLLIYCHYDVQPVTPLNEWTSPPFEPTIRDGEIYARGACDDKGQSFYTIIAIQALLEEYGQLPINLKLLIEGEEESGSHSLAALLNEKREDLSADYLLIVDSGIEEKGEPSITLGGRGLVCMEYTLEEADFDLHSGMAGGITHNPNRALVQLLAKLYNPDGSVVIPGFYDAIFPITDQERADLNLRTTPMSRDILGFDPIAPYEDVVLKPCLEINGIYGGYTDPGFKTVIPAKASAKLSARLVPDQDPNQIADLIKNFLIDNTPKGLTPHFYRFPGSGKGFRSSPKGRLAQVMRQSYSDVFGKPCASILIGGSIPIAVELAEAAEAEMILVGLGLANDRIHSPDEHFGIDRFEQGYLTICRGIELFGA